MLVCMYVHMYTYACVHACLFATRCVSCLPCARPCLPTDLSANLLSSLDPTLQPLPVGHHVLHWVGWSHLLTHLPAQHVSHTEGVVHTGMTSSSAWGMGSSASVCNHGNHTQCCSPLSRGRNRRAVWHHLSGKVGERFDIVMPSLLWSFLEWRMVGSVLPPSSEKEEFCTKQRKERRVIQWKLQHILHFWQLQIQLGTLVL